MPKRWQLGLAMALLLVFVPHGGVRSAQQPALITSIGQSLAVHTAHLLAERAGLEHKYDRLATVDDLDGVNTLILVVGASLKGFGSAGIDLHIEEARTRELLAAARQDDVLLVVLFTGGTDEGEGARGELNMRFIELTAPAADILVVWVGVNEDGYFTDVAAQGDIPLIEIESVLQLPDVFKELFSL